MKRHIFVQSELLSDIAILEVEHNATQRELREALLGLVEKTEEPLIADSTPCRARIPLDVGPVFHGMPGHRSTVSRAG